MFVWYDLYLRQGKGNRLCSSNIWSSYDIVNDGNVDILYDTLEDLVGPAFVLKQLSYDLIGLMTEPCKL